MPEGGTDRYKVGRHCKSKDGEKRDIQIKISLSKRESDKLNSLSKKAGLSKTQFILDSTVYMNDRSHLDPISASEISGKLTEICKQIRRYGTNLNQISRALNSIAMGAQGADPEFIAEKLESIDLQIGELRKLSEYLSSVCEKI